MIKRKQLHHLYIVLVIFFLFLIIWSKKNQIRWSFNLQDTYYVVEKYFLYGLHAIILLLYWLGFLILSKINKINNVKLYTGFILLTLLLELGVFFPYKILFRNYDLFGSAFVSADMFILIFNLLSLIMSCIFIINFVLTSYKRLKKTPL